MKKIYLILGSIIIFLIIVLAVLSQSKKSTVNSTSNLTTPTPVVSKTNNYYTAQQGNITNLKIQSPIITDNFTLTYSPKNDEFNVESDEINIKEMFLSWLEENGFSDSIDLNQVKYNSTTGAGVDKMDIQNSFDTAYEILNVFNKISSGNSSSEDSTNSSSETQSNADTNKVYYSQCGEYGSYSLPSGCALCKAGCGPTTVAMIVSSYLQQSIDPTQVVDLYKKKGYLLGCGGSRYTDAKSAIESYGLKTTSLMIYDFKNASQVASDFKSYLNNGWTIFTLAYFCKGGCGHYFWITDVDDNNNVWAYDPYYGRLSAPPLNENSRYPYPLYRVAFGVKKN